MLRTTLLFRPRPSLTTVYGRPLTCTNCGHLVDVIEVDLTAARAPHWINADQYVCGQCLTATISIPDPYDPRTAPIPF